MKMRCVLAAGALILLIPLVSWGQVVPISDVNADDELGFPALLDSVVTVEGVVTVGTGALAEHNDVYIQDATGGVNVIQNSGASPVVARGDSVRVTGKVAVSYGERTFLQVDTVIVPGARIEILSSGHAPPSPVVVTPRMLATETGEDYEGIYAVVRRVGLPFSTQWPDHGTCDTDSLDRSTLIADADTSCRIWFDVDSDLFCSRAPLDTFDVYGVVIPKPWPVSQWKGHGMLPPSRAHVLSRGAGSGHAEIGLENVFANQTIDLPFILTGEADVLTRVSIPIPDGWDFSGESGDVWLSGPGMASAVVVGDSTSSAIITISGTSIALDSPGTLTIASIGTPGTAGTFTFAVGTAPAGLEPAVVSEPPDVEVSFLAAPGTILINEVYAHSNEAVDSKDRAEFIEIVNPGGEPVDISGWVLSDLDESGTCGGSNLWAFPTSPPTVMAPGEYLVVVKDAWLWPRKNGFVPVFEDSVDYEELQIFEMVDTDYPDADWTGNSSWPDVPNLTLVSPPDDDETTSQEIRLLGGSDGNGALSAANAPGADAVYLYSDRTKTHLVDAMEYRDPVHFRTDYCAGDYGLGGYDDAFVPGPPPEHYSLGRDELSTDTDSSSSDFVLCSWPTPGAVNVPRDTKVPEVSRINGAGDRYIVVGFNEPVDEEDATDLSNYSVSGLTVHDAWISRSDRTVLLHTSAQSPDSVYACSVSGVADVSGNLMVPYEKDVPGYFDPITPLSEIQASDEMGYSPLWGQDATVVGFTTVPPGIFQPDRTSMFVQDTEGWGLNIYSSNLMSRPALEGDLVKASGLVVEYRSVDNSDPWAVPPGSTTEISNSSITVLARGFDVIEPLVLPSGDVGSEEREGVLVQSSGVVVKIDGFAFYIDDGTGACQVYQNFTDLDFGKYAIGDSVQVTGVVLQYDYTEPYFGGYELAPRYDEDLVELAVRYEEDATIETSANVLNISADESIDIRWNASRTSHVAVRVYDLKGRAIATIYDGFCLGATRGSWDGRDDNGLKVPPGAYICHIQARARDGESTTDAAVPIVVGMKLD